MILDTGRPRQTRLPDVVFRQPFPATSRNLHDDIVFLSRLLETIFTQSSLVVQYAQDEFKIRILGDTAVNIVFAALTPCAELDPSPIRSPPPFDAFCRSTVLTRCTFHGI